VISGKGGTGKTSYVAAFACIESDLVLADCDVDAANLHLVTGQRQKYIEIEAFRSGFKASADPDACIGCATCLNVCRFHAVEMTGITASATIDKARIIDLSCEGCGCCADECPKGAISLTENTAGELFVSPSRFGTLVHARLNPGEGTSGKLVTRVREKAKTIAGQRGSGLVLIDGCPGIGCPVIASISGTDAALIVTEPTVSGFNDFIRAADLCSHFNIPTYTVINKCDINFKVTEMIREHSRSKRIEVLGSVPFDPVFTRAQTEGLTVMEYAKNSSTLNLEEIWSNLLNKVRNFDDDIPEAAAK
jgi:MinD superfamily P-loop ATPase